MSAAGKEEFARRLATELAPEMLDGGATAQGTLRKRLPTLAQIAETAAFLASDRAGAMTGAIVNVSAGALTD